MYADNDAIRVIELSVGEGRCAAASYIHGVAWSMQIDVDIRGYRCFASSPMRLTLSPGITAIVGKNNSGKSAVLRAFLDLQGIWKGFPKDALSFHEALKNQPMRMEVTSSVRDPREVFPQRGWDGPMRVVIEWQVDEHKGTEVQPNRAEIAVDRDLQLARAFAYPGAHAPEAFRPKGGFMEGGKAYVGIPNTASRRLVNVSALAHAAEALSDVFYIPALRYAYAGEGDPNAAGPLLGKAMVAQWSFRQSGPQKAPKAMMSRVTEDVCRLFDLGRLSVRATHERDTLEIETDRGAFRLDEVGNGISHALLMLFNAAIRNPSWIMIDEPENGLHAAAQRDFVLTLASYASQGVVLATHSLGLARSVADRVYHVHQEDGMSKITLLKDSPHLADLAASLGFGWHESVEGRTVLVVEGSSDVRIYDRWLTTLGRAHRVLILHMGGSNGLRPDAEQELAHLKKMGGRLVVLLDSDRSEPNGPRSDQSERFAKCCEKLGIEVRSTERRCVESYFTQRSIDEAFPGKGFKAFDPFAAPKPLPWTAKTNGAHVAEKMTQAEILDTDVGQLLSGL